MHLHFCIVIGRVDAGKWAGSLLPGAWKFENWHLYRRVEMRSVKDPRIVWRKWARVF